MRGVVDKVCTWRNVSKQGLFGMSRIMLVNRKVRLGQLRKGLIYNSARDWELIGYKTRLFILNNIFEKLVKKH